MRAASVARSYPEPEDTISLPILENTMLVDNFEDIGSAPYTSIVCRSGAAFPTGRLGLLFVHDTHGLCVFCHDNQWRQLKR